MSTFVQLHLLTSYPPSNLNRDDLGRPKQAMMGNANRLRVSSQSLKRAWRQSAVFESSLAENRGVRTKRMGKDVYKRLIDAGVKEKVALDTAAIVAKQFGKQQSPDSSNKEAHRELEIEQLAHISPEEKNAIDALVARTVETGNVPSEKEVDLVRKGASAADIALFGRMLAARPEHNVEAAAQVAHAISVHAVAVEEDYFTAVDDLCHDADESGAGHLGETEFAASVFYLYVCVDRDLLLENLGGDKELADTALRALVESAATVAPTGKQNSFGSRARASFILAEKGPQQPRSLSVAYLKPIERCNVLEDAVARLKSARESMERAYGACADDTRVMDTIAGEGTLAEIADFVTE
ncbi:MAG: type I-E CRISPR-associated protein Cas7/Cse4/CasC [Chitinivibrionales bacterium]|nr:type I-E CRISPR-associated protein Cas7/Cse4/CasC [Chitinivibrionales bacterium]